MSEFKVCVWCKHSFELPIKPGSGTIRYCSDECRHSAKVFANKIYRMRKSMLNPSRAEVNSSQRKCHDCGKPTQDYRCPECLKKWRNKYHVAASGYGDTYEESWVDDY